MSFETRKYRRVWLITLTIAAVVWAINYLVGAIG
jgi:hypothetical protein